MSGQPIPAYYEAIVPTSLMIMEEMFMFLRPPMKITVFGFSPLLLIFTLFAFSLPGHVPLQVRMHRPTHTNPQSNGQFSNDEAAYRSQLKIIHRFADAYHYRVRISTDISYGPYADETLDQCTPLNAPSAQPGIIMIHGGGWIGGDKSHYDTLCSHYAALGYVVTTINYRLAPRYQWPAQIGDVQLAVRWMRIHATDTGLDPNRMCALGDSAGAHLSLLLDELQYIHPSDVANIFPNTSPTVQCVIDQFGPTDLAQLYKENPLIQKFIYDLLDFRTPPDPLYQDASPLDNIASQTGRALIIQGTQDQMVLPNQSQELQQAFQNNGISVQYISYNGGHEYAGLSQGQINAIMAKVQDFLNSVEPPL